MCLDGDAFGLARFCLATGSGVWQGFFFFVLVSLFMAVGFVFMALLCFFFYFWVLGFVFFCFFFQGLGLGSLV